jgi:hypothetical protein
MELFALRLNANINTLRAWNNLEYGFKFYPLRRNFREYGLPTGLTSEPRAKVLQIHCRRLLQLGCLNVFLLAQGTVKHGRNCSILGRFHALILVPC